jgi:hypothetical protein
MSISQLVRIACAHQGLGTTRQVLALGATSSRELLALEELLRREEKAPVFTMMIRFERAAMHRIFTLAAAGDLPQIPEGTPPEMAERIKRFPKGPPARTAHVWSVEHLTRLLELARLPEHEQAARQQEWNARIELEAPPGARDVLPECEKLGAACRRYTFAVRAARAALAAERYRLAAGRWPEKLDDLVPDYLETVPTDPETGAPLRLRRLPDGLVVSGTNPAGVDQAGAIAPVRPNEPPPDAGFRLWNPELRGEKPSAKPASGG